MSETSPVRWSGERLELLDQRRLPESENWLGIETPQEAAAAIADLVVRGAPAIGITAAYATVLSARQHAHAPDWRERMAADRELLAAARPTAVNLAWALARMWRVVETMAAADSERLLEEARRIHAADVEANRRMGALGAAELEGAVSVLTHCNTGALATGGYGTALGVIRAAHEAGKLRAVFAGETRPWLQGARLTAWELAREGIPVQLVIEGAVATLFRSGLAQWLIVGADRIVANGDVANKIGTYSAALHAKTHGARVMVVAPCSTVDLAIATGADIPIEHRNADEVLFLGGRRIAAAGADAWNPVFDVTPAELIDVIVTEKGAAHPPFAASLPKIA